MSRWATMSIDELIAELARQRESHGGGAKVFLTWEGTVHTISKQCFQSDQGMEGEFIALYIDAEH